MRKIEAYSSNCTPWRTRTFDELLFVENATTALFCMLKVRTDQPLPLFLTCPTYYIVVTSFPVSYIISISTFWMSVKFILLNLCVSVCLFFLFLSVSVALSHIRVYGCKFWKSYERKSWRQALVLLMLQRVRCLCCSIKKLFGEHLFNK